MKQILVVILFFVSITAYPELKKKYSKEVEYLRLTQEADYLINSPWIMSDGIFFFFKDKASKVLVAGDFNAWKPELLMREKNTNFWEYVLSERLPKGIYKYKLIVDDIWISDPYNTNFIIDESGQPVSYFELKEDYIPNAIYPLWIKDDIYEFFYQDNKAKNVYLVGDFNNWNPYSTKMSNTGGGEFRITVRLKPGVHPYCFVVDGEWKADPDNLNQYSSKTGNIVSILFARKRKK